MAEGQCFHPAHQNATVRFHTDILTPALVFGIHNALEVDFISEKPPRDAMQEFADRVVAELEKGRKALGSPLGPCQDLRPAGSLQPGHRQTLSRHQLAHSRQGQPPMLRRRFVKVDLGLVLSPSYTWRGRQRRFSLNALQGKRLILAATSSKHHTTNLR
jgi:hypothetical protein